MLKQNKNKNNNKLKLKSRPMSPFDKRKVQLCQTPQKQQSTCDSYSTGGSKYIFIYFVVRLASVQFERKYTRIDFDLLICWLAVSFILDPVVRYSFNLLRIAHEICVYNVCSLYYRYDHVLLFIYHITLITPFVRLLARSVV